MYYIGPQSVAMSLCISNKLRCVYCFGLRENGFLIQKRFKKTKKTNIDKALNYFEAVYPPVYGAKWLKMKKALFTYAKHAALLNNFSDNEEVLKKFEEIGAFDVGAFYTQKSQNFIDSSESRYKIDSAPVGSAVEQEPLDCIEPSLLTYDEKVALPNKTDEDKQRATEVLSFSQDSEFCRVIKASQLNDRKVSAFFDHIPTTKLKTMLREDWVEESDVFSEAQVPMKEIGVQIITEDKPLKWPENMKLFSFIKGEVFSMFPEATHSPKLSVLTHYLFDGASILPVLALDLQFGDTVLDVCSNPGGKSLAILQTLLPKLLVCNEIRRNKILSVQKLLFEDCIPKDMSAIRNTVTFNVNSGDTVENHDFFDKVLVNPPCLNDRYSIRVLDKTSIFKHARLHERLNMPQQQANLILFALQSTRPGGCVVYSTCTLSPLHNDGAVHLALTKVWRETKMECTVVDMSPTMKNLDFMYTLGDDLGLRYGHIVLPYTNNNYGPIYVCKIIRNR